MTFAVPRALRRALLAAAAGATVVAGVAAAQSDPPTVTIELGADPVAIDGADALREGAVRLRFTNDAKQPATAFAFRLPAGADVDAFERAVAKLRDPSALMDDGSFEAMASVGPHGTYATTIDAEAGRYAVAVLPRRGAPDVVGSFDVAGEDGGAVAPKPDATVRLREYGIGAPRVVDGKGVLRVRNTGEELHELVAARLGKGMTQNEALALLKEGKDRKVKLAGAPTSVVGLVSPGTTNDVEVDLPKGRYVLVCFYADANSKGRPHVSLGMGGALTVR